MRQKITPEPQVGNGMASVCCLSIPLRILNPNVNPTGHSGQRTELLGPPEPLSSEHRGFRSPQRPRNLWWFVKPWEASPNPEPRQGRRLHSPPRPRATAFPLPQLCRGAVLPPPPPSPPRRRPIVCLPPACPNRSSSSFTSGSYRTLLRESLRGQPMWLRLRRP